MLKVEKLVKKSVASNAVIKLESKNLHDYLKTQTQILSKLYEYPEICLAVSFFCAFQSEL